ncbi:hypothetical protein TNCV_4974711 [Trichonephila clavipes]|uniref:Uncharacterized protein n=1 Tax=Trichonephila clavipes TaxID=2585209 RepID=A0A8X6SGW8_TRICX|nr:hypothetical protein TNCV_4974711 [Trichonephila clavipes]
MAMGSVVVRASDSRPERRAGFNATKYPLSTHGFHAKIVEVETGGVPSIVPLGNFAELICTATCMVLKAKANDRRTSSPLPQ